VSARSLVLAALVAVAAAAGAVPAAGAPGLRTDADVNPCHDELLQLVCPDLAMSPPSNLAVRRVGSRVRLLATNHIVNVGAGPLELRAHRGDPGTRPGIAPAYQVIHRRGGRHSVIFPQAGSIYFKAIPRQGNYWKFFGAARFELWTLHADGSRATMVRTGPKLSYCFRDLDRVRSWARTPPGRVYPGCSQVASREVLRLGVSPGWADVYPSTYPENWIDVTGLRGCFAFVHRADPFHELIESREDNNLGQRIIRLPARGGSVAPRGCPGAR